MVSDDLICGLKLTHDGGLAIVEGNRLRCSVEAEKLENRPRYSAMNKATDILGQLAAYGLEISDIAAFAVDGWVPDDSNCSRVDVHRPDGRVVQVEVAGYEDRGGADSVHTAPAMTSPMLGVAVGYRSYTHATDHALASYCTSPFARREQDSLVLVWDGGMAPCLYRFDHARTALRRICTLFDVVGNIYPIFASHFVPFKIDWRARAQVSGLEFLLPISGKAMAYASMGQPDGEAIDVMAHVTGEMGPVDGAATCFRWAHRVLERLRSAGLTDAALLASFETFLGRLLVDRLRSVLAQRPELRGLPLCLSGGCALNIKWNASIRRSGLFEEVWVPPFPNDSGSAIGAACAEMIRLTGRAALDWSVFSGPPVAFATKHPGDWSHRPCGIEELATILAADGEPVVVLSGHAELGPRALGHRSIVAPAVDAAMRDRLNAMKGRQWYRPVAPICLEDRAPEVFAPGTRDPYMLFEHHVRAAWRPRVPAVVHLDGSARLQTVGPDNPVMYRLLRSYERLTGIPVLCNTSANRAGSGFFPDAGSAMEWNRAHHVWSDGTLYSKIWDSLVLSGAGASGAGASAGAGP